MQTTDAEAQIAYETCTDKSLYFTLSLYVRARAVAQHAGGAVTPEFMRSFQPGYLESLRLRNAVEPLFNDIADRERLGAVNDFLLDTPGPSPGERLQAHVPGEIEWTTEGRRFIATPPGLGDARAMRLKRFWYMHANGALSYHLSFRVNYDHTPGDFYFLSLLQKAAAPKEFELPQAARDAGVRPGDGPVGLLPLDGLTLTDEDGRTFAFWALIKSRFESDALHLMHALAAARGRKVPPSPAFADLVMHAPFIEVPGLIMPVSRLLFFFQDTRFFSRLMPGLEPETGRPYSRKEMVQEPCYLPYRQRLKEELDPHAPVKVPVVRLDDAYWEWARLRPEYEALSPEQFAEAKRTRPAMERHRTDCLQYMFIAGFNQNIIDFMNQDSSEILDSIDPIYPANDLQSEESFFVRYANQRAMITYVGASRSLESGNDYIGTCPYAFLIHVVSLHNEFLTRDYEAAAFSLVETVGALNQKGRLKRAANLFYDFRMQDYADYHRDRYMNVFRYDTERDVFEALEKLRGTERKDKYLAQLVDNLESQTRDREARISKDDETSMNLLLGALGVFGFFQLSFEWARQFERFEGKARLDWVPPFLHVPGGNTPEDLVANGSLYLSILFTLLLIGYVAWRVFGSRKR